MTPNYLTKMIAYCYPSSTYAEHFGRHGYYIQHRLYNVEGSGQINQYPAKSAEGGDVFDRIDDPDLWTLYAETDGEDRNDKEWINRQTRAQDDRDEDAATPWGHRHPVT